MSISKICSSVHTLAVAICMNFKQRFLHNIGEYSFPNWVIDK